ncbi:hypothetical protein LTR56_013576 [Elasticomyces elasticus]|nr:hypothetical protein LTR56_013576 [Elasticomyces elasticus]KAK3651040.1 hypothetical protein LTR22_012288 [Elasticomyces elasticus]KAK4931118.1 hypothetical protein LTR49_002534 [Elasticomyces elasticus]KAK5765586.1 hypothetical protein LTS12_004338 [Elasticomyces elasticus]
MELTKAQRFRLKVACRFKRQQGKHLKTPSATQAVLGTTELLEAILLYLSPQRNDSTRNGYSDMLTLLLSQRVCTAFQTTIQGSMHLQRALFFQPSEPAYAAAHGLPDVNPLIFDRQLVSGDLLDKYRQGNISGIHYTAGFIGPRKIYVETLPRGCCTMARLSRRCMPPGSWQRMVVLRPETAEVVPPVEILHVQVASYGWRNGWRAIVVDEVNRKAVVVGGEVASVMLARVAAWAIHNP